MSSVSSIGPSLSQYFQSVSSSQSSRASGATSAATPAASGIPVPGAPHHHHGHGGGFKKIEQAVSDALQSAQASGSSEQNKTIEDAIAKLFKNDNAAPSASTPDPAGNTIPNAAATPAGSATGDPSQQDFFQTLQSYGVSPQQFRHDLLAAVKDAQGGQIDPSAAFRSFSPGSIVDTIA